MGSGLDCGPGNIGVTKIEPDSVAALILEMANNRLDLSDFSFFDRSLYRDIDFVAEMVYLCM